MTLMRTMTMAASVAAIAAGTAFSAAAETTKLRIQTHFSQETLSGQMAEKYINDIQTMSNGEIQVEMFYASSVVKSAETFDAAATGILDCDMTGGAYQTGKNPAFQFTGDLMGGISRCHGCFMAVAVQPLMICIMITIWNLLVGGSQVQNHCHQQHQFAVLKISKAGSSVHLQVWQQRFSPILAHHQS